MVAHLRPAPERSDPPPRPAEKLCVVDERLVVAALAATGETRWVLPADALGFPGRTRLTRIRIWLEGARLPDGGTVHVRMATRGNYLHRSGGTSYRFTSGPLVRDFRYRVTRTDDGYADWLFPSGRFGTVEADGVVDDEVGDAEVQPSPFAEWHVAVTGDDLDLSGLTRVVMQFTGSVNPLT